LLHTANTELDTLSLHDALPIYDDDLASEFFLGGHALEFRLFEQPVFDVEGFLLREGDVGVDGLGAAHDLDGAVVELGGDAALGLDRKSTRLNSSHVKISYAVFC